MEVIVNYKYRMETYIKDTRSMNIAMDHFSNLVFHPSSFHSFLPSHHHQNEKRKKKVAETLGIDYRCQYALPLQTILVGINLLKMFLDQVSLPQSLSFLSFS